MNDFTKALHQHAIDNIDAMLDYTTEEERADTIEHSDLHQKLFNEDYFVIGYYNAEKLLESYGTWRAIEEVLEYEQSNFGEVTTEVNSEKIANMLAYINGEKLLWDSEALNSDDVDSGAITYDQIVALRNELEEAIK